MVQAQLGERDKCIDSLEQAIEFIADDELVAVQVIPTPGSALFAR